MKLYLGLLVVLLAVYVESYPPPNLTIETEVFSVAESEADRGSRFARWWNTALSTADGLWDKFKLHSSGIM